MKKLFEMKNFVQLDMTRWQILALTILRITIGWHFLYEGLLKVINPEWSAVSYLNNSTGPFASIFTSFCFKFCRPCDYRCTKPMGLSNYWTKFDDWII